jgi:flagellar hook-associated protein 1 FlgK
VTAFEPLNAQTLRASDTGFAGANELAAAISALADSGNALLSGDTFAEFATRTVITVGQDIRDINNRLDVQQGVESILKDRRSEVSGVSLDEEVAQMVQFQRAFQASSRVFTTLSDMLELIVTGLR